MCESSGKRENLINLVWKAVSKSGTRALEVWNIETQDKVHHVPHEKIYYMYARKQQPIATHQKVFQHPLFRAALGVREADKIIVTVV